MNKANYNVDGKYSNGHDSKHQRDKKHEGGDFVKGYLGGVETDLFDAG